MRGGPQKRPVAGSDILIKCLGLFILTFFVLPVSAHAATDTYDSLEDMPVLLLLNAQHEGRHQQQYISAIASMLRSESRGREDLRLADIESDEAQRRREISRSHIREMIEYDQNFDMEVTPAEIREMVEAERFVHELSVGQQELEADISKKTVRIMAHDWNSDGKVTADEFGKLSEKEMNGAVRERARDLLALDTNADGVLTSMELEAIALKAFRTVDVDHDGVISPAEKKPAKNAVNVMEMRAGNCAPPRPSADSHVLLVSANSGGAWSDIALTDRFKVTSTVRIQIEKGDKPLYIMLVSRNRVIWRFTGETARLQQAVIIGPAEGAQFMPYNTKREKTEITAPAQAAATGLPREKIVFLGTGAGKGCARVPQLIALVAEKPRLADVTGYYPETVAEYLGRPFDETLNTYSPVALSVGGLKITELPADAAIPVPAGVDADAWQRALQLQPGGLVSLKDEAIVSETEKLPYVLLPAWAGIAQLVEQGILKAEREPSGGTRVIVIDGSKRMIVRNTADVGITKNSNARIVVIDDPRYRITKDLQAYPPGLEGAFAVQFVLPPDIKLPPSARDMTGTCFITVDDAGVPENFRHCK